MPVRRRANLVTAAAIVAAGVLLPLLVGCGGPPKGPSQAQIGVLRVAVARMELPVTRDEPASVALSRFRATIDRAKALKLFGIAAEAATHQGRWHESRGELDEALELYQEALNLDKEEHYRLRSTTDPLPNVSSVAISLANVSLVLEKKGDISGAVSYAERAFHINRNLNLARRVKFDAERLSRLHEQLGNTASATRYADIARSVEVASQLERPPVGGVQPDLPPVPDGSGDGMGDGIGDGTGTRPGTGG
ncbi:MAG: tetratricopeptide repeat protein [Planctomycetota bacterium]